MERVTTKIGVDIVEKLPKLTCHFLATKYASMSP